MLSEAQVAQFKSRGFLLGGAVVDDAELEVLRAEVVRVIEDRDKPGPQAVLNRNIGKPDSPVWQIVNIWEASKPFLKLVHNPTIAQEIAQLTGAKELRVWHDQIQYKPAGTGGVNMWHQDAPYWPPLLPMTQVTAWIALDDVDVDNGCMSMVPGSHLWGDQIQFLHSLKAYDAMPAEFDGHRLEVVPCPVRRGHVHYHHALTWHGSHENKSGRPRRAIAVHLMSGDTRFVAKANPHPMTQFIDAPDGGVVKGDHFPQVWPL